MIKLQNNGVVLATIDAWMACQIIPNKLPCILPISPFILHHISYMICSIIFIPLI